MESAVVEDENDPSDTNNNSTSHTSVGDCINNTILATGVFTSAELYRLARAPITSQTTVSHQQRSHSHHHHAPLGNSLQLHTPAQQPSSHMLGQQQQLQVVKLEQEAGQYCSNNGSSNSRTNGGFSPDPHAHHTAHHMLSSPIQMTQTSITGPASSSASSSPSYAVGLTDLPPHKRLRRMQPSDGTDGEVHEVRGHQMHLHHQQQPQYNWADGHSDSDVSLIKSESPVVGAGGLYSHLHVTESPLSPHPALYHHMQQPHVPSAPHHHHVHQQQHHHHHQQHHSQQHSVLKYQENGDTLSDFVNLVSALSCPSDGHFWSDQAAGQHQSSSHTGSSDPADEVEDSKSLRDEQQEEEEVRDEQAASHQLQVMSQYGHLPGMQPPPPTARPVITPVLDSRWNSLPSPPATAPSSGYLLPEKEVSLGYFRPAFFVSQGLNDSSAQLMLMAQQPHPQQQQLQASQGGHNQRELSSPASRSNVKGSPSPPKSPS